MNPANKPLKIIVFDQSNFKFSQQLIDHWKSCGHTVDQHIYLKENLIPNYDVVYFDWADNLAKAYCKIGVRAKKCIIRGIDIDLYAGHYGSLNYDMIDHFIVLNDMMKEKVHKVVPAHKLRVIQCGIDMNKFSLVNRTRGKNAVYVGRLWIGKNVAGAIDVVNELNMIEPGWTLHIRGEQYHPDWWQAYVEYKIKTSGVDVVFDDRVNDMNEYLEDKDVAINPSFKEAFSYASAESLAKGIPTLVNGWPHADYIWGVYVYHSPRQAANLYYKKLMLMDRQEHRDFVNQRYNQEIMFNEIDYLLYH